MTATLNILIPAFGSVGDVLPFIGIGGELRRRGHDVALIANPYFEERALEAGLSFSPVGTLDHFQALMSDTGLFDWKTAVSPERAMAHFVHVVEGTYDATIRRHQAGRTVLFGGPGLLGAHIAREQGRIPLAFGFVAPSRLPSRYDPPHPPWPLPAWARPLARSGAGLGIFYLLKHLKARLSPRRGSAAPGSPPPNPLLDEVNRIRARVQLPLVRGFEWRHAPERIICLWPSWFADRQKDWPAHTAFAGFPFYPSSGAEPGGPTEPPGTDGPKPVVFTTGSIACRQEPFFATAVESCRILKRPGLLVTPHVDQVPRPLPPNVVHVRYAPFEDLFARSALVVHHGGIGTIALALAAGVPQIVRPMMGEQFDLGNRVQRLGVGRMLTGDAVTPAQLARAIDSMLKSRGISSACRRWQARTDRSQGLARAADSIEGVVNAPGQAALTDQRK